MGRRPVMQLKTYLENLCRSQRYDIQTSYNPNDSDRLTFLFLNHDHVRQLLDQPPVIEGHIYHPIISRYMEPVYIATNEIIDIHGAKVQIDRYIQQQYGATPEDLVVRRSRLALNGSVYCGPLPAPIPVTHKIGAAKVVNISQIELCMLYKAGKRTLAPTKRPPATWPSSNPFRQKSMQFSI